MDFIHYIVSEFSGKKISKFFEKNLKKGIDN